MRRPVEVLEMKERSEWEVDEWYCTMGTECLATPVGSRHGHWLGHNSDGGTETPFIVVCSDGFSWMVCEDCAGQHQETIDEYKRKWSS